MPSPSPTLGPGINLNQAATASLPHLLTNGSAAAVQQHQQLLSAMQQPQLVSPQSSLVTATAQPNSAPSHQPPQRSSHHQQHNHHYSVTSHTHGTVHCRHRSFRLCKMLGRVSRFKILSVFYQVPEKHNQNGLLNGTESSLNVINRLAASNSDITITSTHGSPQQHQHPKSLSSSMSVQHSSSNGSGGGTQHSRSSPTSDFLADSPSKLILYGLVIRRILKRGYGVA